jgi:Transglutaminase-like superfamily
MRWSSRYANVALVILSSLLFISLFKLFGISATWWDFSYLMIGRIIGPIPGLVLLVAIIVSILLVLAKILDDSLRPMAIKTSKELLVLVKKRKTIARIVLGLVLALIVMVSFSMVFMLQVSQARTRIDNFVAASRNDNFEVYIANVSSFLNANVNNAYNKPEGAFKIDQEIATALLDSNLMKIFEIDRADIIVFQGWGSCGQAAILIEELLRKAGYEARDAYFKNIDHEWAEVYHNGTWLIVDPWYIGNLVDIKDLKNLNADFQKASGVEVRYINGTVIDASPEHGY